MITMLRTLPSQSHVLKTPLSFTSTQFPFGTGNLVDKLKPKPFVEIK